jgi:hypothetical protein
VILKEFADLVVTIFFLPWILNLAELNDLKNKSHSLLKDDVGFLMHVALDIYLIFHNNDISYV